MENDFCDFDGFFARVGEPAPDFNLEGVASDGEFRRFNLNNHRGDWVVLFFYPLDFTFVCPTEITQFSEQIEDFRKLGAVVYGCSTDSVHAHKAWLKDLGTLQFPLLSDITHEISDAYNVLVPEKGVALRGTFVIDPEGILRWAEYNDLSIGRNVNEVLRVIAALQTGELCPVNWNKGEGTLGKA